MCKPNPNQKLKRGSNRIFKGCKIPESFRNSAQAPKSILPLHPSRQSSRYVGFMDKETYTNPIDQSIAHLPFHEPSDLSLSHALTYKSHLILWFLSATVVEPKDRERKGNSRAYNSRSCGK
ncbi:hypothetical protein Bca4012_068510 [Brassica carinata]